MFVGAKNLSKLLRGRVGSRVFWAALVSLGPFHAFMFDSLFIATLLTLGDASVGGLMIMLLDFQESQVHRSIPSYRHLLVIVVVVLMLWPIAFVGILVQVVIWNLIGWTTLPTGWYLGGFVLLVASSATLAIFFDSRRFYLLSAGRE
jgi:hypothetical protein